MNRERCQQLFEILLDEIRNTNGIQQFVESYAKEIDIDFIVHFRVFRIRMEEKKTKEYEGLYEELVQIEQILLENFIGKENVAIIKMQDNNPINAYSRAVDNIDLAFNTKNDVLVAHCAITIGNVCATYYYDTKIDEAIKAYQLASEKFFVTGKYDAFAEVQCNLGDIYLGLPADRKKNIEIAIKFYNNALEFINEKESAERYADIQFELGVAYFNLPAENRGDNLLKSIECYKKSLRNNTKEDARTQSNMGCSYIELPDGTIQNNAERALECYNNSLKMFTEKDFPQEYARILINMGSAYRKTENNQENQNKALANYRIASAIAQKNDFRLEYADSQYNIGIYYLELLTCDTEENIRKAIYYLKNTLKHFTKNNYPMDYARTQNRLGFAYFRLSNKDDEEKNFHKGINCFIEAFQIFSKTSFPGNYAKEQYFLGTSFLLSPNKMQIFASLTYNYEINLRKAICCYENALVVYTEKDYPQEYANTQKNMGEAYFLLFRTTGDNINKALECFNNALRIYSKKDYPEKYADTQKNMGETYRVLPHGDIIENFKRSIECHKNALSVHTENDYPREYAMVQLNLGNSYLEFPNKDSSTITHALECYKNALRCFTKENLAGECAKAQMNLGNVYSLLPSGIIEENLKKAVTYYNASLTFYNKTDFPQEHAYTQINLGACYIKQSIMTKNEPSNFEEALFCFYDALEFYTEKEYSRQYATVQTHLGYIYSMLSQKNGENYHEKAIMSYENALKIYTEKDFPWECVKILYNLSRIWITLPLDYKTKSYEILVRAIEILETRIRFVSSFETCHLISEQQADIYYEIVSLCISLDKADEAFRYAEQGKSRTLMEMVHSTQLRFSEKVPKTVRDEFLDIRDKLDYLRNYYQKTEFDNKNDQEILSQADHFEDLLPNANVWQEIDVLQNRYNHLLNKICDADPGFAATEQVQSVSIDEINLLIPQNTVFVECFTGRNGTYIFVLDGRSDARDTVLFLNDLKAQEIERFILRQWYTPYYAREEIRILLKMIYEYLVDIKEGNSDKQVERKKLILESIRIGRKQFSTWYKSLGLNLDFNLKQTENIILFDQLDDLPKMLKSLDTICRSSSLDSGWFNTIENMSSLLVEKLWYAKDVTGKSLSYIVEQCNPKRIVFIPHGGLHLLPLHLMPVQSEKTNEERLFDKYEIAYAPSASMLRFKLNQEKPPVLQKNGTDHFFAVANPDKTLTFADIEVQVIAKHFENSHVLWYENATKENTLSESINANVIHFSCHGSFQVDSPLDSRLILAGGNLTLREIFAKLKIPNANTVVMSACETGMIELERGDEYIGLTSGFMYAGASTIISSLWAVNDLSTSLLIIRWYENVLQKDMGKVAALNEAQKYIRDIRLSELAEYFDDQVFKHPNALEIVNYYKHKANMHPDEKPFDHPYYWGAFTCNGNWE